MTACPASGGKSEREEGAAAGVPSAEDILLESRALGDGLRQSELSVPSIRCGGCVQSIERALARLDGVVEARVNLTAKRVTVRWKEADRPPPFADALHALGYPPHLPQAGEGKGDGTLSELLRALAVAGFASGNIMLLSVSVWSGAEPEARNLFHWISAAIALPVLAYSGRVFFRSAWAALRHGRTNMDVPISIGVALAFGMSLYDTIHHGPHAYFDASVMLLFFLLIGRTLDHVMREKARSAVKGLARLGARGSLVEQPEGGRAYLPIEDLQPGMTLLIAAGERVPVDGRVLSGTSDLDCSLVTGESLPRSVAAGAELQAGTLNLTGPLRLQATAVARDSFLAEMVRLMEAAESSRSAYRRVADRASRLYAPVVHALAFLSFLGWMVYGGDLHQAVTIAVAVLIITCPCALGLAVPMVQVVAARRLFQQGIMVKDGGGLERLAQVDTVVFDKTGTLTLGRPQLRGGSPAERAQLPLAAALAAHSRHPYSRALVAAQGAAGAGPLAFEEVREHPGFGVEAQAGSDLYRLGLAEWALEDLAICGHLAAESGTVLSKNGKLLAVFRFDDPLRRDARQVVAELESRGLSVEMLSGDHAAPVEALARELGIRRYHAEVRPDEKAAYLQRLAAQGRRVLMVGDGLNDAPALAAAHVSVAPASGADVGRNAADLVFLREELGAVPQALDIASRAAQLTRQNFALAVLYNMIALPFAVLGFVTPLFAAVAMSSSSLVVVANAMRLNRRAGRRRNAAPKEHEGALSAPPVMEVVR